MSESPNPTKPPNGGSDQRLVSLLDKMERDVKKDWKEIWNRYPIATRSHEESDIVSSEQLSINGYLQAIDEIRDFLKANGEGEASGLETQ